MNVTYQNQLSAVLKVDVHEGEGSVTFHLTDITGIAPANISRVEFSIDGGVPFKDFGPEWFYVRPIDYLALGTHAVTVSIFDLAAKLVKKDTTQFTIDKVQDVITNGGFEQANTGWHHSLVGLPVMYLKDEGDGNFRAFFGVRYVRMGGKGTAHNEGFYQDVKFPHGANSAKLSFRLRIDSPAFDAGDKLYVEVVSGNGNTDHNQPVLWKSQPIQGNVNTKGPGSWSGYVRNTIDLSQFAGQDIRVRFRMEEDNGDATMFYIDDVSLVYTTLEKVKL